jgi:hypothetical protein
MKRIDTVVVFPYSSNIESAGSKYRPKLSVLSELSVDAGLMLSKSCRATRIIFIGETCFPRLPNTAELMKERFLHSADQPIKIIMLVKLGDKSLNNTYLQVEGLNNYLKTCETGTTVVIGLHYHNERIRNLLKAYKLKLDVIAAESILPRERYVKYTPYIDRLVFSERILNALAIANPKGSLFKFAVRLTGPRVVDIIEYRNGLKLVNTLSRRLHPLT